MNRAKIFHTEAAINNFTALALLVFMYCMLPACNNDGTEPEIIRSDLPRNENPQVQEGDLAELVAGNTQFALDCYGAALSGDNNAFFSPLSISLALAMTYAGARNNTEKEMGDVLHFTLTQDRLHPACNALDLHLAGLGEDTDEDGFRLHIANATWGQTGYPFLQNYLDVLALHYGAGLMALDFAADPEGSREVINGWVEEKTEDRIQDLLPRGSITPDTRLVLTNAIYFKADWLLPFAKEDTAQGTFHAATGEKITAQMMSQCQSFAYSASDGQYQAVEMLYKGGDASMVVLLPDEGTFDSFEASLNADRLSTILAGLSNTLLKLTLPKFSFVWDISLVPVLQSLGMIDAFSPADADFSGMNGTGGLFITDIFHKAFVAVDEEGTEAAAATAVVVGETSIMEPEVEMNVNRPFIFLIRERQTGTIFFMGKVMNPQQQ